MRVPGAPRWLAAVLLPALVLGCGSSSAPEGETVPTDSSPAPLVADAPASYDAAPLEGRVFVKLDGSLAKALRSHLRAGRSFASFELPRSLSETFARHQISAARPAFSDEAADEAIRDRMRQLVSEGRALDVDTALPHLENVFLLEFDGKDAATRVALDLEVAPEVVYAEAVFPITPAYTPSDPLYSLQWGPRLIQAEPAWDLATGAGQTIAIIDSGIEGTHSDLQAHIDPSSYDAVTGSIVYPPVDNFGHGTAVAGIAAAEHGSVGVAGMAPNAGLLSVNVVNSSLQFDPTALPDAILYAALHAGIINASLTARSTSRVIEDAVQAAHALDVLFVAAAGNDSGLYMCAPANVEWAMAVGAVLPSDHLASYSNTGTKIDVVAPGGDPGLTADQIMSTAIGNTWAYTVGTSMASPHVAGLAALVREMAPTWNVEQVRSAIRQTALDVNQGSLPGFDAEMGFGRVDAEQAVLLAQHQTPWPTANLTVPKYDQYLRSSVKMLGYSDIAAGASGTYRVEWSNSLNGAYTPIATGSVVGGAAPGNRLLGVVSPATFPQPGRYFLRLTTTDGTNNTQSVDTNEIEVCGGCTALPAGARARWRFNRGEWPNALDSVGANHGTYQGAAAPGPNGYVNDGAGFFGWTGSRMTATAVNPPSYYTMTVQAWMRPGRASANGIIAAYRPASGQGWEVGLQAGSLYFASELWTGVGATHLLTIPAVSSVWQQITVVVSTPPNALNPVTLSVYSDGQLMGTANVTGQTGFPPPASGAQYFVGGGQSIATSLYGQDWPFEGNLDEVTIFDRALTPAQIQATYAARCGGTC